VQKTQVSGDHPVSPSGRTKKKGREKKKKKKGGGGEDMRRGRYDFTICIPQPTRK
jgi:hypothetical protein